MPKLAELLQTLSLIAPLELAEEWDNVGLLVGRTTESVSKVMTCLTLTPDVAEEAVRNGVDLIVSHHPLMFRSRQQITRASSEGTILIRLIQADIAVYSPHTAYDSAREGINAQLATEFGLQEVTPVRPLSPEQADRNAELKGLGSGRIGRLTKSTTLQELTQQVESTLPTRSGVQFVGEPETIVNRVAIACGSAAAFQEDARSQGADVLITGEARFHACLEARTEGTAMIIAGHYATERPAIERLAEMLEDRCKGVTARPSRKESDPITLYHS